MSTFHYHCITNDAGIVFSVLDVDYRSGIDDIVCDAVVCATHGPWALTSPMSTAMVALLATGTVVGVA